MALLLPLEVNGVPNANYLEFYQGFLLGLDSVRLRHGISTHVTLFNTARDPERIEELTTTEPFRRARLIVGPVCEGGAPIRSSAMPNGRAFPSSRRSLT